MFFTPAEKKGMSLQNAEESLIPAQLWTTGVLTQA